MKMMHTDDAECQSFFCMVNSMAEPGSILGVQIAWDSNGSFRNWVKTSDILFLRVINSCLHLSLTKWHCSSGRHLVKALNYSNSGDRDLLQKSWNSYNVNCSYPCIFDACTPNNCLWIFFYPPVVTSVIFFFFPPWNLALFSDGVISPNFVPVNRPLSDGRVTKLIWITVPCKWLYFTIELVSYVTWIRGSGRLWSGFWKPLPYFGNDLRFSWPLPQDRAILSIPN